ncbi:ABC transporter ATP-binding protein [Haloarcula sp. 1CSR25-25]|jgi:branched-chain amino acid transport system ATP-binding protein|uniref:ABC transporter ATP-binding protein n=1 Tax=Haloarcula sp. 1CSR25-25 TaxID=2862545 RepID=UPI00289508E2|nr:ABC transporter ATP-binding protein [Haloarcula sp. 1CSR25-25]MDT3437756.1 ABC transporter ATP-binding protein [Haloarcula sp. 1CSR25-25]
MTVLDVDSVDTYYGPSHVLHDVSLNVEADEIVALIGRNGAGKTTTLRTIMGVTPPKNGDVRLHGDPIQGLSPNKIRRHGISWTPEDRRVFPDLTVAENLRIANRVEPDNEGTNRGTTFTVEEVYESFDRLDERRDQRAGTMSGGEQQMLAIARSLVGPPVELLALDEPSEGLAPKIVDDVRDMIERLNERGMTILLVEQNAHLALELADRAYILETGHIELTAPADELLADQDVLETYLGVR